MSCQFPSLVKVLDIMTVGLHCQSYTKAHSEDLFDGSPIICYPQALSDGTPLVAMGADEFYGHPTAFLEIKERRGYEP